MWQPKEVSTVHGAETSCDGAAACLLLGEGKACQKRQSLEIGDVMEGFKQQRVKAKQNAWGEVWVMHGGLDLRAQGKARDEAKNKNRCSQLPLKQP